jgi:nitrite reductase/ring-hydroxylating ferredoxin subunit
MRTVDTAGVCSVPERHRIASVEEVPPGSGKECVAAGRIIALFNVDGEFHAIDGICAHAGGPVGDGALNDNIVTCPWHGWQYDVKSGQHCLTPTICQQSFPVTVEDGEVFAEL